MEVVKKLLTSKVSLAAVLGGVAVWVAVKKIVARRCRWPVARIQDVSDTVKAEERLRVVVIGGGVGGTFAAMWLRQMFGDRVELTLIHSGPIGGRCQPIEMTQSQDSSSRYECGASIISEMNEYILDMMKIFNLSKKDSTFVPMAIWDGSRVLFQEAFLSSPLLSSIVSAIRVLQRYTMSSILKLKRSLKSEEGLPDFQQLYQMLQNGATFAHPRDMLTALTRGGGTGCYDLTQESSESFFGKMDISKLLVSELVQGGMKSNYGGQSLQQLHALVGLISVAGGIASTCFRIKGGNVQIAEKAAEAAQATVVHGTAKVVKRAAGKYEVSYDDTTGEWMTHGSAPGPAKKVQTIEADVVLLAHHLAAGQLKVDGIQAEVKPGPLRRCCTHFLRGSLKGSAFGLAAGEPVPLEILTVGDKTPFYSIGVQAPVDASKAEMTKLLLALRDGATGTFKVFAPAQLSEKDLSEFFDVVPGSLKVTDWLAYPAYTSPAEFMPFVLAPGLIYLNAVETIGSAMEMSAIAARNAVNLVREWHPRGRRGA